jgi:hypothetical protein
MVGLNQLSTTARTGSLFIVMVGPEIGRGFANRAPFATIFKARLSTQSKGNSLQLSRS